MTYFNMCVRIISMLILIVGVINADQRSDWSYKADTGPAHWGDLNTEYTLCETGKNQSPINIVGALSTELPEIDVDYQSKVDSILNNGHTIQVNMEQGSRIKIENKIYPLLQFHFHSLSENTIEGKHYPLEAHFVHADEGGNLGVIAIMFKESKRANKHLEKIWKIIPSEGKSLQLTASLDVMKLLPKNKEYYRFNGSLTTPPCSEGVEWIVMKTPLTVSQQQILQFQKLFNGHTNRPVQPLHARLIVE